MPYSLQIVRYRANKGSHSLDGLERLEYHHTDGSSGGGMTCTYQSAFPVAHSGASLLLPLAATLLLVTSSCYAMHNENSWIRIQNMGGADATIEIKYLSETGQVFADQTCPAWGVCPYHRARRRLYLLRAQ